MCVLISSSTFVYSLSHSKKNSARKVKKCTQVVMYGSHYCGRILIKFEFYRQILEKQPNTQILDPPSGAWLCHADRQKDGRTDGQRQTDLTKLILIFAILRNRQKMRIVENIWGETSNEPVSKTGQSTVISSKCGQSIAFTLIQFLFVLQFKVH